MPASTAAVGRCCAHCGQRGEHDIHSIRHFIQEVTEDLTHADSGLWRTMLALVLKPGHLTREFLVTTHTYSVYAL